MTDNTITVIVADDHGIFRQGLSELLRSKEGIAFAGEASNGNDALRLILDKKPDIAVLDVSMPELSGIEIAKELKRRKISTKVIILTMHKDPLTAERAVKAGAGGYILKDNTFEELLYAIKVVCAGGSFISPSLAGHFMNHMYGSKKKKDILTEREKEVLALIAKGRTNKQIAEKLFISIKTVETHRLRIMKKLSIHKVADLVRYAIKSGLTD
jgi:DNA-binding NarL/FixJ family response regulator